MNVLQHESAETLECYIVNFLQTQPPTALQVELNETPNNESAQRIIILMLNYNAYTLPVPDNIDTFN